MKKPETYGEWVLIPTGVNLFILKLDDPKEGSEQIWLTLDQLNSLKTFLNAREQ